MINNSHKFSSFAVNFDHSLCRRERNCEQVQKSGTGGGCEASEENACRQSGTFHQTPSKKLFLLGACTSQEEGNFPATGGVVTGRSTNTLCSVNCFYSHPPSHFSQHFAHPRQAPFLTYLLVLLYLISLPGKRKQLLCRLLLSMLHEGTSSVGLF